MNIVFISHYAGSLHYGMACRPYYCGKEWTNMGHDVTIVAASYSHLRTIAPEIQGTYTEEDHCGIRYVWIKTPSYRGNGARRAINIMTFAGQLSRYSGRIARRYRPDVVVAGSTHPLDIVPAHMIARKSGAQLVFEVHDLWPLTPIELSGVSPRHPFMRLLQWAENFAYRKSDKVVSLLPHAAEHMQEHGMAPHKFAYVPNGIDVSEWGSDRAELPAEHREILNELKEQGRFLLGYAGYHGVANALKFFVEALPHLQNHPIDAILVGRGPEKELLQQRAAALGVTNARFLPPIPKVAMPAFYDAMDALYLGWNRKPIYRFGVSPNKLFEYLMAGKPVIHAVEAPGDIVAASACGLSIPPEDPREIAQAVVRLMAMDQSEREAMGRRGRAYVLAHHDYRLLAQQFLDAVAPRDVTKSTVPHVAPPGPGDTRVASGDALVGAGATD